jgi:hypothetical protein
VRRLKLDGETGIPAPRFPTDGQHFYLANNFTVLLDLEVADFRELQFAVEFEAALRIRETIVAMGSLESRKACSLSTLETTEEGFEGLVETAQGVLQHLAENASDIFSNLFDSG